MPLGFKVKYDDARVQRALQRLRAQLDDLRVPLQNAATELTRRIRYRFDFKRDPDGQRWAPWAPSTEKRYAGNRQHKLMLYTRNLRDGSRFIAGRKDLRAVLGTPYGKFHEQPNGEGGKLPRRAFLLSRASGSRGLAKSDQEYVLNAIRYQLRKAAQTK